MATASTTAPHLNSIFKLHWHQIKIHYRQIFMYCDHWFYNCNCTECTAPVARMHISITIWAIHNHFTVHTVCVFVFAGRQKALQTDIHITFDVNAASSAVVLICWYCRLFSAPAERCSMLFNVTKRLWSQSAANEANQRWWPIYSNGCRYVGNGIFFYGTFQWRFFLFLSHIVRWIINTVTNSLVYATNNKMNHHSQFDNRNEQQ